MFYFSTNLEKESALFWVFSASSNETASSLSCPTNSLKNSGSCDQNSLLNVLSRRLGYDDLTLSINVGGEPSEDLLSEILTALLVAGALGEP